MQEYNVILTWEAIYDIVDISEYIEKEFSIERADRFENDIRHETAALGHMSGFYSGTQLFYRNYLIHKKPFPPSIIFYIIKDEAKEIHVLRILREERDWKNILKATQDYSYPDEDVKW